MSAVQPAKIERQQLAGNAIHAHPHGAPSGQHIWASLRKYCQCQSSRNALRTIRGLRRKKRPAPFLAQISILRALLQIHIRSRAKRAGERQTGDRYGLKSLAMKSKYTG